MIYLWGCIVNVVIDVPIVGQSYHLKDWSIDCQRTLNFYPQAIESGNGPNVSALIPTPGLVKRFELDGPIRGLYTLIDSFLCVAGTKLYRIYHTDSVQALGEITGSDLVIFSENSLHVMIIGDDAYKFTIKTNQLEKLVINDDTGFFGASDVTFLDSRLVWTVPNSGRIQWSTLLDTKTDALSYATAETRSDNLVRTIASNGQLWLIGEKTTEVWSSTGANDLPFQRMSGAYIPMGCIAKNSVCQFGGALVWLSQTEHGSAQIVMTEGYGAKRISNHAIESEISRYSTIQDAYSYAYQQDGHAFFVISFPSAQKTWCFDAITQMWHERSFYNLETWQHEHHRTNTHCFFNGEHLVGDRENGKIYRLCPQCKTDDHSMILRERITPVINPQGQRLRFTELELIMQTGQMGNSDPQILLSWSDDRGRSWSTERQTSIGKIGEFKHRVVFRRLGQSFNRVFRLRVSDASQFIVLGAKAKVM